MKTSESESYRGNRERISLLPRGRLRIGRRTGFGQGQTAYTGDTDRV